MNVKLKIEQKDEDLVITEASLTLDELLFVIHTLIDGVSKHTGIPIDEVYKDILGEQDGSNS